MLYPKDPNIRISRTDDSLSFEWSWKKMQGYQALVLAAILAIALTFIVQEPTSKGLPRDASNIIGLWVTGTIYVGGLVIFGLVNIVNRTIIEATSTEIFCYSAPFRFTKGKRFSCKGVMQFFVRQPRTNNFPGFLFVMDENSECRLVTYRLPSNFAANQICHELQDFYGLEDLPVYGQNTQPHQPGPRNKQ